jgi:hypothetical protein
VRVLRRRVDGIADREELECRATASAVGPDCMADPNFPEIKDRCCAGGRLERCRAETGRTILIGRGCLTGAR